MDPGYVEHLVHFAQAHPATLVGSIAVDFENPDIIHSGGVQINWWTAKHRVINNGRKLSEFPADHYVEVSMLPGRGTLIPMSVFHQVGLFDDKHFQQCGDTELPVRATKSGYRLVVSYGAIVKSHMDSGDMINVSQTYKFADWKKYFFDIKSNARLKYRFYFARTAADGNPVRLLSYFFFDLARIAYHFIKRLSV